MVSKTQVSDRAVLVAAYARHVGDRAREIESRPDAATRAQINRLGRALKLVEHARRLMSD